MDALAAAIDVLFAAPNIGEQATWRPGGAGGSPIRVIRRQPDQVVGFGDTRALLPTVLLEMRVVDAPTLAEGDAIVIGGSTFRILAAPKLDALGLVLTAEAAEA